MGSLDFVDIDIVGPLPKSNSANKSIFIIRNCYFKLTRVIRTTNTTATGISNVSMKWWVANFEIYSTVLTDNGPNPHPIFPPHSTKR